MKLARFALLLPLLLAPACGDDTPTEPTNSGPVSSFQIFTQTLSVGGTGFFSFQTQQSAVTSLQLFSLTPGAAGASNVALDTPLRVGIGVPQGTGCGVFSTHTAPPSLLPLVKVNLTAGTYCAEVRDEGRLTGDATFGLKILLVSGGTDVLPGPASTETFVSTLAKGGASTRSFTATTPGTVTVTLESAGPPSDLIVGFGLGVPTPGGPGCSLTVSRTAAAPIVFSTLVDQGTYCVKIFDTGAVGADGANFSIKIVRP